jgi:hypothetical protein
MGTLSKISVFEKKLCELGLSYQVYPDDYYLLRHNNDTSRTVKVKLICSDQADESEYGSRNGNIIESIGVFKFKLSTTETYPDFFILGFESISSQRIDFVIISTAELKRRFIKKNRISKANHKISIVFWLMDVRFLFDCTDVGVEWEWFYLSRGVSGRMVDDTEWDFTEFLNGWDRLKIG